MYVVSQIFASYKYLVRSIQWCDFVSLYCHIMTWTLCVLFTTGNRVIDVFKYNQIRKPILLSYNQFRKLILRILFKQCIAPVLLTKSAWVRVLQRNRTNRMYAYIPCMFTCIYIRTDICIHKKRCIMKCWLTPFCCLQSGHLGKPVVWFRSSLKAWEQRESMMQNPGWGQEEMRWEVPARRRGWRKKRGWIPPASTCWSLQATLMGDSLFYRDHWLECSFHP